MRMDEQKAALKLAELSKTHKAINIERIMVLFGCKDLISERQNRCRHITVKISMEELVPSTGRRDSL